MASEGVKYMGKVLLQQEEGLSWDSRAFWEYRSLTHSASCFKNYRRTLLRTQKLSLALKIICFPVLKWTPLFFS